MAQVFYGWKLLGAFWVIAVFNLAFPAYGSAVLNAAMAAELGFDRQALGTMFAVYLAMSGLPGPLVAASVNRVGVRWTLVIGSLLVIAGAVMLATIVDTVPFAILAFGLLVGIGVWYFAAGSVSEATLAPPALAPVESSSTAGAANEPAQRAPAVEPVAPPLARRSLRFRGRVKDERARPSAG